MLFMSDFFCRRGDPSECPSLEESPPPCKDRGSKPLCRSYKRRSMCYRFQNYCRKNVKRHADFVKSVCHWYILVVKIMLVYPEQNVETAVF